jgi:hypothetical protein
LECLAKSVKHQAFLSTNRLILRVRPVRWEHLRQWLQGHAAPSRTLSLQSTPATQKPLMMPMLKWWIAIFAIVL